jgi:hypothetical protein
MRGEEKERECIISNYIVSVHEDVIMKCTEPFGIIRS